MRSSSALRSRYLTVRHKLAYLLGDAILVRAESFGTLQCLAALKVKTDDLVDQWKLAVLKLFLDVLLYRVRTAEGELSVRQVEAIAKRETERLREEYENKSREIKPRMTYYTEALLQVCPASYRTCR